MKKLLISASVISILTLSSTSVFADRHHQRNAGFEDTARVTHVEPIYTTIRVSTPQRECYQRPHHYRSNYRPHQQSYTSTIAGGLIGGVLGNQFGKGHGKTAMTIAGTLLGGSVGRDANYQSRTSQYNRYDDEQCQVSERYHQEERIDGYRVTYKYQGRSYTTQMDHDPGRRIPIEVSVRPIQGYY